MKNTKNVPRYIFGAGSLEKLSELLAQLDPTPEYHPLYLIDHFFEYSDLVSTLPAAHSDNITFVDTTHEPTTTYVDELVETLQREDRARPLCVIGIGGGSTLDIAKAVSNLLTNGGKAEAYQGWDLVKVPGVYKIGIPTLSGTGAEASRTCVLSNKEKNIKLGMNSDYSVFDQLILDPDLPKSVPRDQYFYSGMDTYFHCMESLRGAYRNAIIDALSHKAMELCREVFLSDEMQSETNRQKLMVASYLGGCAAGNTGLVHPLSAGLSVVLGIRHGLANCLAMTVLQEFYPEEWEQFNHMLDIQHIDLPQNLCTGVIAETLDRLYHASIIHEKPLANALGDDFKSILTKDKVSNLFHNI